MNWPFGADESEFDCRAKNGELSLKHKRFLGSPTASDSRNASQAGQHDGSPTNTVRDRLLMTSHISDSFHSYHVPLFLAMLLTPASINEYPEAVFLVRL